MASVSKSLPQISRSSTTFSLIFYSSFPTSISLPLATNFITNAWWKEKSDRKKLAVRYMLGCLDTWIRVRAKMKFMKKIE
ncbi:hypothetical protein CMV_006686 [Castanea mollissima]|uniref:Uncharacterized protein n=1 Tax=Castanea mollissima TaxID=60419 RepID=A0A8J4RB62_9ROSI|nr:hypothetical protein CMV_006686 [Castanea mollissima]